MDLWISVSEGRVDLLDGGTAFPRERNNSVAHRTRAKKKKMDRLHRTDELEIGAEAVQTTFKSFPGAAPVINAPKKRAIALTAFLACLSFLLITGNAVLTFLQNVTENDHFWTLANQQQACLNVSMRGRDELGENDPTC